MSEIKFFMAPADEAAFFEMLLSREDTLVLPERFFPTANPEPIRAAPEFGTPPLMTLVNRQVTPTPTCTAKGSGDKASQFTFEASKDCHIQLDRSRLGGIPHRYYVFEKQSLLEVARRDGEVLRAGRLYAKLGWLKSSEHNRIAKAWFASFEAWFRERYRKVGTAGWMIGPEAEKHAAHGGIFGDG